MVTAHVVDPLTQTSTPAEPQLVVPNLDNSKFDASVQKTEKVKAPDSPAPSKENAK